MRKIYYPIVAALVAIMSFGCSEFGTYDDSELLNKFNDLSQRVTALETQVAQINGNISALQTIVLSSQNALTITSATKTENGWLIIFSNGEVANITNGQDGANGQDGKDGQNGQDGKDAPVLGVSLSEGVYYWTITINGQTTWLTDAAGNKLRVTGENGKDGTNGQDGQDGEDGKDGQNGVTPMVNIDSDGYWCVSYDGGKTYNRIVDADGNPISALGKDGEDGKNGEDGTGTSIGVVLKDGNVYFTLPDGSTIIIPIKDYSLISIEVEGLQEFYFGETREFAITLAEGVETMLVKPDGWRVALDSMFVISAPSYSNQNAEAAGYVAISATDANGYNEIFKIQVEAKTNFIDIPDATFKAYLTSSRNIVYESDGYNNMKAVYGEMIDADGDGEISSEEAANITGIYMYDYIFSLQGIEKMPNLQYLDIYYNELTTLDLSGNPHLKYLDCAYNKLKTLDLSANTELEYLYAYFQYAPSTGSTVSRPAFNFNFDDTTARLDEPLVTKEKEGRLDGKAGFSQPSEPHRAETDRGLETLILGEHPNLYYIDCRYNRLSSINVDNYPELRQLRVNSNLLTSIDVSRNPKLRALYIDNNSISSFDISNNTQLVGFGCGVNPLSSFAIPSNLTLQYLYIAGIGLSSLDAISAQTALLILDFSDNSAITSVDLSIFPNLTALSCNNLNQLTTLDVSALSNLTDLSCYFCTNITSLDLSNNINLQSLDCDSCSLTSLDVSNCPQLANISTSNNTIGVLDLSNNPLLQTLYCYNCGLTELDLTNNTKLYNLYCYGNQLTTLDISTTAITYNLDCNPMNDADGNNLLATLYAFTTQLNYKSNWDVPSATQILERTIYESSDYSTDGTVLTLQTATVGNGVNLIIMGDGFVDTDMATGGNYETWMTRAMDNFFSEEPYTTLRDRFNVYTVKAVSKHGAYSETTETVFGCQFGDGTAIEGDDSKVFSYAMKIDEQGINTIDLDNSLVIVALNSPRYAGTCWMYYSGAAIAYQPITDYDNAQFAEVIHHEAGGHGFSKLLDEYQYSGTIPTDEVNDFIKLRDDYGWGYNVDVTNDPTTIQWARYLTDERYSSLVGIYEGAMTYATGAWRPTDYSIMRHNTGGFNAPSRESIYRRVMSLSENDWTFDFETFAAFDAPNRSASATAARRAQAAKVDMKKFVPLTPPVVVKGSWQDAK